MKERNKISLINKTDRESRAVFGNEKKKMYALNALNTQDRRDHVSIYSKQFCRNCGFCWNCSVCPWEVSEGETEDLPLRLLGGLFFAINIAHIPATNWIRTVEFLVESSFIVLLESYVGGGLILLFLTRYYLLCFLRAHVSFFLFWSGWYIGYLSHNKIIIIYIF